MATCYNNLTGARFYSFTTRCRGFAQTIHHNKPAQAQRPPAPRLFQTKKIKESVALRHVSCSQVKLISVVGPH